MRLTGKLNGVITNKSKRKNCKRGRTCNICKDGKGKKALCKSKGIKKLNSLNFKIEKEEFNL